MTSSGIDRDSALAMSSLTWVLTSTKTGTCPPRSVVTPGTTKSSAIRSYADSRASSSAPASWIAT